MYLGPLCYCYALNYHFVYLAIPWTCHLCMKKQHLFVLFICNRKKIKFKSVQINMKQVSYYLRKIIGYDLFACEAQYHRS